MIDPSPGLFVAVLAALTAVWAILIFNKLVRLRQLISNSWGNVETELQRRYELIPNLVETVKGYAAHERAVLESVVKARLAAVATNGAEPEVQASAERDLVATLRSLFAIAEAYPTLQASSHFLELQKQLANTEDRIQLARRIYNANVRDMNIAVESFPSMLIASIGGFQRAQFFETEPIADAPPAVDM